MTRIRLGFGEWAFLVAVCWDTDLTRAHMVAWIMALVAMVYDWIEARQQQ